MGPLRNVAWGLLVVAIDVNIDQLDLVADPVGWAVVLFAILRLRELHPAFGLAVAATAVALVASVPEWLGVDGLPIRLALGLAELGLLFTVCTALMDLVPAKRHLADQLRWWALGVTAAFLLLLALVEAVQGTGRGPLVILTILAGVGIFAAFVGFLVLLFQCSRLGPAAPVPARP
jgi:hypothetical protein